MSNARKLPQEPSWQLEQYCTTVCSELSTLAGTILGELEYGLHHPQASGKEQAMTVALQAVEQLLQLTHNLRVTSSQLAPAQTTDLSTTLLEVVDWAEREFKHREFHFEVQAESPTVGAMPPGVLELLLKNLIGGLARNLPPRSTIDCRLSRTELHFDFRLGFHCPSQPLHVQDGLFLEVVRKLTRDMGGKVLWELGTEEIRVHLQFPRKSSTETPFDTQRTSQRVAVTLPVTLQMENRSPVETHLRVLSRRGAYLLFPQGNHRPQRDEIGALKIHHFPGQSIEIPRMRIASCLWSGNEPGVGIEFLRLDAKAERILEALIRCHGKS